MTDVEVQFLRQLLQKAQRGAGGEEEGAGEAETTWVVLSRFPCFPPRIRYQAWSFLLRPVGDATRLVWPESQEEDAVLQDSIMARVIDQDVDRTRRDDDFFCRPAVADRLRTLLRCYCRASGVHYMQGMNELAAPFVCLDGYPSPSGQSADEPQLPMRELVTLFGNFIAHALPTMFLGQGADTLQCVLSLFNHLVYYHSPFLASFLEKRQMTPEIFATPWFVTMFSRYNRVEVVLALWDGIVRQPAVYPAFVALAFLVENSSLLLATTETDLPEVLSHCTIPSVQDALRVRNHALQLMGNTPAAFASDWLALSTYQTAVASTVDAMEERIARLDKLPCMSISPGEIVDALMVQSRQPSPVGGGDGSGDPADAVSPPAEAQAQALRTGVRFLLVDCREHFDFHAQHIEASVHMDPADLHRIKSASAQKIGSPSASSRRWERALAFLTECRHPEIHFVVLGYTPSQGEHADEMASQLAVALVQRGFERVGVVYGGYPAVAEEFRRRGVNTSRAAIPVRQDPWVAEKAVGFAERSSGRSGLGGRTGAGGGASPTRPIRGGGPGQVAGGRRIGAGGSGVGDRGGGVGSGVGGRGDDVRLSSVEREAVQLRNLRIKQSEERLRVRQSTPAKDAEAAAAASAALSAAEKRRAAGRARARGSRRPPGAGPTEKERGEDGEEDPRDSEWPDAVEVDGDDEGSDRVHRNKGGHGGDMQDGDDVDAFVDEDGDGDENENDDAYSTASQSSSVETHSSLGAGRGGASGGADPKQGTGRRGLVASLLGGGLNNLFAVTSLSDTLANLAGAAPGGVAAPRRLGLDGTEFAEPNTVEEVAMTTGLSGMLEHMGDTVSHLPGHVASLMQAGPASLAGPDGPAHAAETWLEEEDIKARHVRNMQRAIARTNAAMDNTARSAQRQRMHAWATIGYSLDKATASMQTTAQDCADVKELAEGLARTWRSLPRAHEQLMLNAQLAFGTSLPQAIRAVEAQRARERAAGGAGGSAAGGDASTAKTRTARAPHATKPKNSDGGSGSATKSKVSAGSASPPGDARTSNRRRSPPDGVKEQSADASADVDVDVGGGEGEGAGGDEEDEITL